MYSLSVATLLKE